MLMPSTADEKSDTIFDLIFEIVCLCTFATNGMENNSVN